MQLWQARTWPGAGHRLVPAARSDPKYPRSNTSNQNLVSFSCLIRQPDMLRRSNWEL